MAPACMHTQVLVSFNSQTYQPYTLHHSFERRSLPVRPDKAPVQVLQAPDTLSNVKEWPRGAAWSDRLQGEFSPVWWGPLAKAAATSHDFGMEALCTGVTCAGDSIISATPACCRPLSASKGGCVPPTTILVFVMLVDIGLCCNNSEAKQDSKIDYAQQPHL